VNLHAIELMSAKDAAQETVRAITALCADLGIPPRLRDAGADEESLPEMARQCADAGYNRWNPRHTRYQDFLELFRQAF
jgi:alcohol dehydrogenase